MTYIRIKIIRMIVYRKKVGKLMILKTAVSHGIIARLLHKLMITLSTTLIHLEVTNNLKIFRIR